MWRNESVLGNHGVGGGSRNAGTSLVNSPHSELVFTTLYQTINFTLDLVAHGFNLLDRQGLSVNPLSHILLALFNDVMSDGSTTICLWRSPGKVCMVWTPIEDVRFATGSRLVLKVNVYMSKELQTILIGHSLANVYPILNHLKVFA